MLLSDRPDQNRVSPGCCIQKQAVLNRAGGMRFRWPDCDTEGTLLGRPCFRMPVRENLKVWTSLFPCEFLNRVYRPWNNNKWCCPGQTTGIENLSRRAS